MSTTKKLLPVIRVTTENVHEYFHLQKENVFGKYHQIVYEIRMNEKIEIFKSHFIVHCPEFDENIALMNNNTTGYIMKNKKNGDYYNDQWGRSLIDSFAISRIHNIFLINDNNDLYFLDLWNIESFNIPMFELYEKLFRIWAHAWNIIHNREYIYQIIEDHNLLLFPAHTELYYNCSAYFANDDDSEILCVWIADSIKQNPEFFGNWVKEFIESMN